MSILQLLGREGSAKRFKKYADEERGPDGQDAYHKIRSLTLQYQRYEDWWRPDLERYVTNARALWGLNFGQWPAQVIQALIDEGRRPATYNILLDKALTFIGSILGNSFDVRYSPAKGKMDSLCLKLQDMYYSDKALMEWDMCEIEALLDSACAVGYESMYISSKYHDLGNITWIKRNPRRVLLNPTWKGSNPDDLKDYFTWSFFSVQEIIELFPVITERLTELARREARDGINYGDNIGIMDYQTIGQKWGDRHLVYEFHYVTTSHRQWEYDKRNGCPFPETGEKFHSQRDIQKKMDYITKNELSSDDITFVGQTVKNKMIRAACPTLDAQLLLLDNPDIIQTGNCNLYPIGMKMEGQYLGTVDQLYDLQRAINKTEMCIDDIQMRSAKGSYLMDKALVHSDPAAMEEIETHWNEPGFKAWVEEGATLDLPHGGIVPIPKDNVSQDVFQQQERRYALADRFSKTPGQMDGRSESKQEPNVLFENKVQIGMIGQKYYMKLYEIHKKQKAMAYAKQAKITYAGAAREFGGKDGAAVFEINKQIVNRENGLLEVHDDISLLPDMKVTMVPAKNGETIRAQIRDDLGALIQAISADPNNRFATLVMTSAVIDTTVLPDEEKESITKAFDLLMMQAGLQLILNIKDMQAKLNPQPQQPQLPPPGGRVSMPPEAQLNAGQAVENIKRGAGLPPQDISDGITEPVQQQKSKNELTEELMRKGTPQQEAQPQMQGA